MRNAGKGYRCHTVNSSCLMYHSYEVDTHNRFSILSCVTDDSVFLNDSSPSRGTAPWHRAHSPSTLPVSASSLVYRPFDPCLVQIVAPATSATPIMRSLFLTKGKTYKHLLLIVMAYAIRQPGLRILSVRLTQISYCLLKPNLITKFLHQSFCRQIIKGSGRIVHPLEAESW